jgi:tetratricopeptide (TPR) repeat protein
LSHPIARAAPASRARRRAVLWGLGAAALHCAAQDASPSQRNLDEWRRLLAAPAMGADPAERARWLATGEAALAVGDAIAAHEAFQRAAQLAHAADTECSIVRALMQAGRYRQALAFAAHAALAHRDLPAGSSLYAWLLHAGAQTRQAEQQLAEALARAPDDAVLRAARAQLATPWPRAEGALLAAPLRVAPYAHGTPVSDSAQVRGSALLGDAGRVAYVPTTTLPAPPATLHVRNGLGATVAASLDDATGGAPNALRALGVSRLRLSSPLPLPPAALAAMREPFAGSAVTCAEFARGDDAGAAWPLLRQGFLGRASAAGGRTLGIERPPSPGGGPVFDASGRLAGMSLARDGRTDGWVALASVAAMADAQEGLAPPAAAAGPATRAATSLDETYESALYLTLQLIVS